MEEVREIRKAFEALDAMELRRLGNALAERAAIEHDTYLAKLSVIAYALSKIVSKPHFLSSPRWPEYRREILALLNMADKGVKGFLKRLEEAIWAIDERDGMFVRNIVEKARIKMAARAYGLGISLSTAAELFDADKTELSSYVGQTKIHDEFPAKIGIRERLDALRRLMHGGSL